MKVEFQISASEMEAAFGLNFDHSKPVEITLGKEVFTCYAYQHRMSKEGWNPELLITMSLEGRSKRLQDIAEAKALVNKTKEAHKEAQRKLAELTEGK